MKKVSLFLGMVLAVSFAMAQNVGTTLQFGDENDATLSQAGTSNTGVVYQLKGNENEGTLIQSGSSNNANLIQGLISGYPKYGHEDMAASNNIGFIRQVGASNNVYDFYQLGNGNTGSVDIAGNSNRVEFQQGWSSWDGGTAVWGDNNHAAVTQNLNNNFAGMWQYGDDNTNNIAQNGNWNNAAIAQGYIYAGQGIAYVPNVVSNVSNVSQAGDNNNIRFMQLGSHNILSLTQTGGLNKVGGLPGTGLVTYFRQTGNSNEFYGAQSGSATLEATSGQTGDSNYINLNQSTGDNAEIIQSGNIGGNDAYLFQGGGGQDATIIQLGNGNYSNVSQAGL